MNRTMVANELVVIAKLLEGAWGQPALENLKVDESTPELKKFLDIMQDEVRDYFKVNFPSTEPPDYKMAMGQRYVKISREDKHGGSASVEAFIDRTNGDVLKAASWKVPAKHARGNIFEADNGKSAIGRGGMIKYLR